MLGLSMFKEHKREPPAAVIDCKLSCHSLIATFLFLEWLSWGSWTACSVTCGKNGRHERYRECSGGQKSAERLHILIVVVGIPIVRIVTTNGGG